MFEIERGPWGLNGGGCFRFYLAAKPLYDLIADYCCSGCCSQGAVGGARWQKAVFVQRLVADHSIIGGDFFEYDDAGSTCGLIPMLAD